MLQYYIMVLCVLITSYFILDYLTNHYVKVGDCVLANLLNFANEPNMYVKATIVEKRKHCYIVEHKGKIFKAHHVIKYRWK